VNLEFAVVHYTTNGIPDTSFVYSLWRINIFFHMFVRLPASKEAGQWRADKLPSPVASIDRHRQAGSQIPGDGGHPS
jgi:hypothetical protein